jgi:tripartite-type tricarboxylate transporter receptor subunit TctC
MDFGNNKTMKKFFIYAMIAMSSVAYANQPKTVQVVWPFAAGSTQAVMIRNLLENANAAQKNYQFIFVARPGAGGSIAANSVLASDTLTILASTSSFYTRPLLYKDSHDVDKFSMVSQICENAPVAIYSRKYKSLNEMQGKEVTFGMIPGSITQLFVYNLKKNSNDIKVIEVPYKDTITATTDMLGKHIDVSVDLLSLGSVSKLPPNASVVAISGNRKISNYDSMKSLSKLTNNYWFFVPKATDISIQHALNTILSFANSGRVKEDCTAEQGNLVVIPFDKLNAFNEHNKLIWKNMTMGIEKQ